jgi:hypothetical protein
MCTQRFSTSVGNYAGSRCRAAQEVGQEERGTRASSVDMGVVVPAWIVACALSRRITGIEARVEFSWAAP